MGVANPLLAHTEENNINKALRERVTLFIGDLDDASLTPPQKLEADELYNLLTRKPGRQKGWRKPATADTSMKMTDFVVVTPVPDKEDHS